VRFTDPSISILFERSYAICAGNSGQRVGANTQPTGGRLTHRRSVMTSATNYPNALAANCVPFLTLNTSTLSRPSRRRQSFRHFRNDFPPSSSSGIPTRSLGGLLRTLTLITQVPRLLSTASHNSASHEHVSSIQVVPFTRSPNSRPFLFGFGFFPAACAPHRFLPATSIFRPWTQTERARCHSLNVESGPSTT
jgi:hypothetical protein